MQQTFKTVKRNLLLASALVAGIAALSSGAFAATSEANDLRLTLDKINLDVNMGRIDQARDSLAQLESKYPGNADVAAAAFEIEARLENRGKAFAAASEAPASSRETLQREALLAPYGAHVSAGYDFRSIKEAFEHILRASGIIAADESTSVALDVENVHIQTRKNFFNVNGVSEGFSSNRQYGTLTVDKMFTDGQEVQARLYAQQNNVGVGAQYTLWDSWGATSIGADYNSPNKDYVESIVQHGTKDVIRLERKFIFTENLQAKLAGTYSFYSLDNAANVAEAPGWSFNVDYFYPISFSDSSDKGDLTLGGHYAVDAEYFTHVSHRTNALSEAYDPLLVSTYEVHAFSASAAKELLPGLKGEVLAGIGVNRIKGNSGPQYGASLSYEVQKGLALDVHASRNSLGGENNSEREDVIGVNVRWNY